MFGELGNSDIHDNEPNYGFDEFYNGDNGYSSDNDRLTPSQDEDLWDVGSYDSAPSQDVPVNGNVAQNDVQQSNLGTQGPAPQEFVLMNRRRNQGELLPHQKRKSMELYIYCFCY